MKESIQHALLLHWPLIIPTAVWVLLFSRLLTSDILKEVLAIACIALMLYQWRVYRRSVHGARFVFLSLVVTGLILASIWIALNVVRVYTYDGESGLVYGTVVRIQDGLVWATGALLVVVAAWVVVYFALWLIGRCRVLVKRSPLLSEKAVALLVAMPYRPDADWRVNDLPFGSIFWADEMPSTGDLFNRPEDMAIIHAMFGIRLKLWDGDVLNGQDQELWDAVRQQVPDWALFKRLRLSDEQKLAREEAEQQVERSFGAEHDSA